MKVETMESLVQEFPCLFRDGMFFECGPGWTQLIRDLCSRLEPICIQQREAGEEFVLVAAQVKSNQVTGMPIRQPHMGTQTHTEASAYAFPGGTHSRA